MMDDDPHKDMQDAVETLLPDLEKLIKSAKNMPARRSLTERLEYLRAALDRAKQMSPRQ